MKMRAGGKENKEQRPLTLAEMDDGRGRGGGTLGPEWCALVGGLEDKDEESRGVRSQRRRSRNHNPGRCGRARDYLMSFSSFCCSDH